MAWLQHIASNAPEVFLLLAIAVGTLLGRVRIGGFSLGATACILLVSIVLSQIGTMSFPPVLRAILFGLFVFTIGYRAGPQFFASLSVRTLSQVILALFMGATGLVVILIFAKILHLDSGTAAGLGAGALTQSAMIGTAVGALTQLDLPAAVLSQEQANVAAGYAVTYVSGYILVLLFVPFVAPRLMGVNLADEAAKLEASLAKGGTRKAGNLAYRKFQARTYLVSLAAGRTIGEIEAKIGARAVIERLLRKGKDRALAAKTRLLKGDEILLAGPSHAIVTASSVIGPEIDGEHILNATPGQIAEVYVTAAQLHGRSLAEIVQQIRDRARGVFLRSLTRHGLDVPITPSTRIYVGDVMSLVGVTQDVERVASSIGQIIRASDRTDIAFIVGGLAGGLLVGLASITFGSVPLTLGGGGGALVAGLVGGWLRSRRPTFGAFPPAAQQALSDIGLGGFIAAIGLANGSAALAATHAHGLALLGAGIVVTVVPMIAGTLFAYYVLKMNPVIVCGALAGAMTVDAAVTSACEVAKSQTPVLGVAVPYAVANVVLTVLGPVIIALTFSG
jgi:aspartate-alanine antiporter